MADISSLTLLATQLKQLYGQTCKTVCSEYSLTQTEFDVLEYLSGGKSGDTSVEISKKRLIKKANVCTAVDRLIKKGYIIKQQDETDKRVIHLKLTSSSSNVILKIRQANEEFVKRLKEYISESELEGIYELASRLIDLGNETVLC